MFKHGGGIINRKLLLSVLIFLSIALFLNISICSAASADNEYIQYKMLSTDNIGLQYMVDKIETTLYTNVQNTEIKEHKMAAGAPVVVNGLTLAQLKDGIARVQAFFNKNGRLPKFVNFGTRKIAMATFQKNIATQGLKINTVIVNGLTLAQMKDGISRAQAFYNKYGRLPNSISFGKRKIPIATFQKNIATQGLKINIKPTPGTDTSSIDALAKTLTSGLTSSYNKAVAIFNWVKNNINYSFYYNTKYGAEETLKYRTGNCCDYSNLLVALARSAGITARYVHGTCQFSSGKWYGHVWAQFYVNGNWYNADAISTSNSFGVINNWNTGNYKFHNYYTTLPF